MWGLKRGLSAAAATGRFRRFAPNINDFSQICSHAGRYRPSPPWTHGAAKGQCRNYQDLTKDPPELAKLYDRVCRTDRRPALKINFLKKCGLDGEPRNRRRKGGRNSEFSSWSKHSDRRAPKKDKNKKRLTGSDTMSFDSSADHYFSNPEKFKRLARRLMKSFDHKPKLSRSPRLEGSKSTSVENSNVEPYSSPTEISVKTLKAVNQWEDKWDEWEQIPRPRSFIHSYKSSFNTSTAFNSRTDLEPQFLIPVHSYHFDPIDVKKHRKSFMLSHSLNSIDFELSWPRGWPTLEPNAEESKPEIVQCRSVPKARSRRLARKLLRRKFAKAVSCQTEIPMSKCFFKYHTYVWRIPHRCRKSRKGKRKRFRKAVACQTERLWESCELCKPCREDKEPEKPYLVEMRKRQAREELRQYYLRMSNRLRPKFSPSSNPSRGKSPVAAVKDTESAVPKPEKANKELIGKMQLKLHQCLAVLALCDHIVGERLRKCRAECQAGK
ncbi:uncharacterized protein Dana_GF24630 [Drosophila ananassae]|uniref:Uncharacterized protein n=1 Tax=Drosophila ananassae TaxID=7217 RepID=B3MAU1_DROAN|nr:uncharacterized protein LOC6507261 [Drosophila ananassae]EDV39175.1 uncharacterized protein Dana_GF24630 [Drosophila ananassae]